MRSLLLFLSLSPLLALAACETTFLSISTDGRIQISVVTRGTAPDPDGYSVALDGAQVQVLDPDGAVTLVDIPQGPHVVQLSALAENCAVEGQNPRSIALPGGETVSLSFVVVCGPPRTGGFRVVVSTTGTAPDPDGYSLTVAGTPSRFIEINAEEVFSGLEPGLHLVTLKDLADGCTVVGGNPQPFTVIAGKTVRIRLSVTCGVPDLS